MQFHIPANALIFATIEDMWWEGGYGQDEKPLNFIGVTNELRDRGDLERAGGAAFVTELFTFVPTAANVDYYIEILQEKWRLRRLIQTCTEFATRAYGEQNNVDQIIEEFRERAATVGAGSDGHGLPLIMDGTEAANLYGQEVPPEVIKGMLHKGSKMVIGGSSKSFKTWCLLDLALSVAAGVEWWNISTTKGRVLYLNLELQPFSFGQRQNVISGAKAITLQPGQLDAWHLRGFNADLATMALEIIPRTRDCGYALIILDPIYKCMGGRDENAAGDIGSLLNEVERLAVQTGAAVIFGAHYSKGSQASKESIDRVSGSGVFARDPDSILTLTRHEEEGAFAVEATLRNFAPVPPFVVRWDFPLMVRDGKLNPEKLKKAPGREARYSVEQIVACLQGCELKTAELCRRIKGETGMSTATFHRLLSEGQSQGLLHKSAITGEWEHASK